MRDEDKERYQTHLNMVKAYLVPTRSAEGATEYRIFLNEHLDKAMSDDKDPAEAKKEAKRLWDDMTPEAKREFKDKKKENEEWYKSNRSGPLSAYTLYCKQQFEDAREKGESITMKDIGKSWKSAKSSTKEKFSKWAEELKEEREKDRDAFELATGIKPKRPLGAYRFFLMEYAKEGKFEGNPIKEGPKVFKKLSESEKDRFARMAQRQRLAYQYKMMEYKQQVKKTQVRAPSAYNHFCSSMKGEVPKDKLEVKGGFFNFCFKKWSKMDETARKKYVKMAEDSKREAEKSNKKMESAVFEKPKRPGNAMTFYIKDHYDRVKKENKKLESNADIFKACTEEWSSLSDKEKKKYEKVHEEKMEEYKANLREFEDSGFYNGPGKKTKSERKSRSQSAGKRKKNSEKE